MPQGALVGQRTVLACWKGSGGRQLEATEVRRQSDVVVALKAASDAASWVPGAPLDAFAV